MVKKEKTIRRYVAILTNAGKKKPRTVPPRGGAPRGPWRLVNGVVAGGKVAKGAGKGFGRGGQKVWGVPLARGSKMGLIQAGRVVHLMGLC